MKPTILATIVLNLTWLSSSPLQGVTPGQTDTFESGVTLNWTSGSVAFSTNVTAIDTGGPGGGGDSYLEIDQPSSFHISAYNTSQWTGNFLAANISAIEMDLTAYDTAQPLGIRLVIYGPGGAFTSVDPIFTTSSWDRHTFGLTDTEMIYLSGSGPAWLDPGTGLLADTLASVSRFQIRNDPGSFPTPIGSHPQHINATLAIDNITAIPEPASLSLFIAAALFLRRKSKHR